MSEVHIMVDIETMGYGSNTAIIEIAAVAFNIDTGEIIESFCVPIDLQSCLKSGLEVKASTILWWMEQDEYPRHRIATQFNTRTINEALILFRSFVDKFHEPFLWGRSPRFDLGIIYDAYRIVLDYQDPPWNIRRERCVRTYESLAPHILKEISPNTSKHNPLADCLYQIQYITKIHNLLNKIK